MLALDETYWFPSYEMVKAGEKVKVLVGGPYSANGVDDLSIRPVADAAVIDHETAS